LLPSPLHWPRETPRAAKWKKQPPSQKERTEGNDRQQRGPADFVGRYVVRHVRSAALDETYGMCARLALSQEHNRERGESTTSMTPEQDDHVRDRRHDARSVR